MSIFVTKSQHLELSEHLYKIALKLSDKYGISKIIIKDIIISEFLFINDVVRKGDLKAVRLQYWGIYGVMPKRKAMVHAKRKEQEKEDKELREKFLVNG